MEDALIQQVSLIDLLTLERVDDRPDTFTGRTMPRDAPNIYGGQYLGQAVAAAASTVDGKRKMHAMHAFFLRSGDLEHPVEYVVERLQDGRSFARRRVQGFQNGSVLFSTIVSFQTDQPGLSHQTAMPDGIPAPEDLPAAARSMPDMRSGLELAFDIREVPQNRDGTRGAFAVWMRATELLPNSPSFHHAALAFASDYGLLLPALLQHGLNWQSNLIATSLDHALWLHAPVRMDQWHLFLHESPQSGDSRGLTSGRFYTREGVQVASAAQEGMMRVMDSTSAYPSA